MHADWFWFPETWGSKGAVRGSRWESQAGRKGDLEVVTKNFVRTQNAYFVQKILCDLCSERAEENTPQLLDTCDMSAM